MKLIFFIIPVYGIPKNVAELMAAGPIAPTSNSPLYPLDFQNVWQASEPAHVNVDYDIPVYGTNTLLSRLEADSDSEAQRLYYKKRLGRLRDDLRYLRKVASSVPSS